ncbi:MAG: Outer membrane protein assembly factor BamB, contains PQQ-like beta-propeller repeat [Verrucomicrobia bacterium]|nr:MAG: Outer membrane protein assembly factor BamB, contains PQQ-like beta-propeller repeat [Verrucomicrobiota bacterium]
MKKLTISLLAVAGVVPSPSWAADWPQWGGTSHKNMVSKEPGIPVEIKAGEGATVEEMAAAGTNLKWVAKLGSQTYGTPTIAAGRVLVGTNNNEPRNAAVTGDRGVVMSFDEKTGAFQWQLTTPKLGAGKVSDWEFLGICSSVTIDAKAGVGYVVTNRGEVLALDLDGMADGNDGPYQDEAKYQAGGLDGVGNGKETPAGKQDADIVWGFDMRGELGVFPHNVTSSSVVMDEKNLYVTTSNGVDWSHLNIPAPLAPCLVSIDKATGKLVGEEGAGIGERIMHCNWSSPTFANHNGKPMVIFGAGDGFVYGFNPETVKDKEGFDVLQEIFRYDGNKKEYRFNQSNEPIKYATYPGPSEYIASAVYHDGKIYAAIGQDPEHGEGVGLLSCISADSKGASAAPAGALWTYDGIKRTISTPSVTDDGLVFIADYSGKLHCVDAKTGKLVWEHDTFSHIWGSSLVVDGRVYLGTEDGELIVIKASASADANHDGKIKDQEVLSTVDFPDPIYSSPVVANGTLYVTTQTHLYAFAAKK